MINNKSYNKYDFYIILLLASLSFGAIGGAYTPVRILTVLLLPSLISLRSVKLNKYIRSAFYFLIFFLFYSFVSLAWSPDPSEGFKAVTYDIVFILLFLELISFAYESKAPYKSLFIGWSIAIFLTGAIGMWEIFTDNHLSISTMGSDEVKRGGGEVFLFRYASATFGNYNTYVTVICFSLPFLFYSIVSEEKQSLLTRVLSLGALLESIIVLFYNGSRGGLFSLAIIAFVFVIHIFRNKNKHTKKYSILIIALLIAAVVLYGEQLFATIAFRAAHGDLEGDESRVLLIKSAIDILWDTTGLGTGAGGLYETMRLYNRGGVETIATHNMYIELLAQYGLIVFVWFSLFIIELFKKSYRSTNEHLRMVCQMAFWAMPTTMVINSLYLLRTEIWCYFATLYIFVFLDKYRSTIQK